MSRGVSIQTKIVVPFVCLFLVAPLLTALAIMRVSSRLVENRWKRQVADVAQLLGQGGVPATKGTLEKLKSILGVEIVRRGRASGSALSTRLSPAARGER